MVGTEPYKAWNVNKHIHANQSEHEVTLTMQLTMLSTRDSPVGHVAKDLLAARLNRLVAQLRLVHRADSGAHHRNIGASPSFGGVLASIRAAGQASVNAKALQRETSVAWRKTSVGLHKMPLSRAEHVMRGAKMTIERHRGIDSLQL